MAIPRNPLAAWRRLAAVPAGRVALALFAFVLAATIVTLAGVRLADPSTPVVVVLHAAVFPAVVLGTVLSWAAQFEFARVHGSAAGVVLLAVCVQALEPITFQLGPRGASDALSHVTGFGLLLLIAAATVMLGTPAARRT